MFPLSISATQISPKPSSFKNSYFIIITPGVLKVNWDQLGVWGSQTLLSWQSDGAGTISGPMHMPGTWAGRLLAGPGTAGAGWASVFPGVSQAATSEPPAFSHQASGLAWLAFWERESRLWFVASVAPSITVTALLADAVTKACWGSRRGGRGLHFLVGDPNGSGRACLGNTVWHTQKPSRGTHAR